MLDDLPSGNSSSGLGRPGLEHDHLICFLELQERGRVLCARVAVLERALLYPAIVTFMGVSTSSCLMNREGKSESKLSFMFVFSL